MYEVNAKKDYLNKILDGVYEKVENDNIDGFLIISMKKDEWAEVGHFFGNISLFEWLGVLEHAKKIVDKDYAIENGQTME